MTRARAEGRAPQGRRAVVVGAGLSGLAAAVRLLDAGVPVEVHEAAAQAGGRCRSYLDPKLGLVIDNGNHLVLSGNAAVADYLARIGASHALSGPEEAILDFADLGSGRRWRLRANPSPLPWWVFAPGRRPPSARAAEFLALAPLLAGGADRPLERVIPAAGGLWRELMEPFLLAALNTRPEVGSSALAGQVVRETLGRGGRAYRPRVAVPTLAAAFVDPALRRLSEAGRPVRFGRRLRGVEFDGGRARVLDFGEERRELGPDEVVILAVPAWSALDLVPGLTAPLEHRAILNGHFHTPAPAGSPPILGLLGGTAEWIFSFPDRIGVTVSDADRLMDLDREELGARLWNDVARALSLPRAPLPPWQVVKEKRATFAATPEQNARRPAAETAWSNLLLAGDWTRTGLPATIEGALRSGFRAAELAMRRRSV